MQFNRALTSLSEKHKIKKIKQTNKKTLKRNVFCATININIINLNNKAPAVSYDKDT